MWKIMQCWRIYSLCNCKCRKKLIDKLVEECTETTDEVKITKITSAECNSIEDENKCKTSCTVYVVLIAIIFTICIGTGTYFFYYKYMNHDKKLLLDMIMSIKHQIIDIMEKYPKKINIKNRTHYFFDDMINIEYFDSKLLKIDKKPYKNIDIYNIEFIKTKMIDGYENI